MTEEGSQYYIGIIVKFISKVFWKYPSNVSNQLLNFPRRIYKCKICAMYPMKFVYTCAICKMNFCLTHFIMHTLLFQSYEQFDISCNSNCVTLNYEIIDILNDKRSLTLVRNMYSTDIKIVKRDCSYELGTIISQFIYTRQLKSLGKIIKCRSKFKQNDSKRSITNGKGIKQKPYNQTS
jgi:hypothetical protein